MVDPRVARELGVAPQDEVGERARREVRRAHPVAVAAGPGQAPLGQLDQAAARAAASELLRLPARERPTAYFATDASMSLGVIEAILDGGLRWPENVSVVGFDDADWTRVVRPELTVVAQPVRRLGERAADILLRRVRGEAGAPAGTVLDARIVPRGSVAPP